jgi:hypothetical protein
MGIYKVANGQLSFLNHLFSIRANLFRISEYFPLTHALLDGDETLMDFIDLPAAAQLFDGCLPYITSEAEQISNFLNHLWNMLSSNPGLTESVAGSKSSRIAATRLDFLNVIIT